MNYDFVVIGAGISGASVGYELAARGSVLLLETESSAGHHSTGRSAALFTRNFGGEVVRRINATALPFFEAPPDDFTDTPLLAPRGALTVAAEGDEDWLDALLALSAPGAEIVTLTSSEALERVPFLRPERVAAAVWEAGVHDIDVARLHQAYLRGFARRGGTLARGAEVMALDREGRFWAASTRAEMHHAGVVVNAAGAWAGRIGAMAGAADIGLVPKRRTCILIDAPEGSDVGTLPVTEFAGSEVYVKPDGGRLMASPGDATPDVPHDVQPDEMDVAVLADWLQRETRLTIRRIAHKWAGLRSFVADDAPVVGFDPQARGFFWLAAQGGYGIMMAPALSRATAALCTGEDLPADLRAQGVERAMLAPERLATADPKTLDATSIGRHRPA